MSTNVARPERKSRYRKIEMRMWGDEKFRELSPLQPSGQALWIFLLTGPHTGPIPGLFRSGRLAMAEELEWTSEAFAEAFAEVSAKGMAKADWKARVVWISKAISINKPESPNVVKSWKTEWDLIPECDLKREAYETLKTSIYGLGDGFAAAFDKAIAKPSPKPLPKHSPNPSLKTWRNQEQEQEQEQEQKNKTSSDGEVSGKPYASSDEKLTAAAVAVALIGWERERKKAARGITASHPQVIDLAALDVTADELRKAYDAAVADRLATDDPQPVNAGFVRSFVEKHRRPPPPKRNADDWHRTDPGIERKASELGVRARPGENHQALKARLFDEISRRERGNGAAA